MSTYRFHSDVYGTKDTPFSLSPDITEEGKTSEVTSIDLEGSYVNFSRFCDGNGAEGGYFTSLEDISNGHTSNADCSNLFMGSTVLTSVCLDMSSAVKCLNTFYDCTSLVSVSADLRNLIGISEEGENCMAGIFANCTSLESFSGNLNSVNFENDYVLPANDIFIACTETMTSFDAPMNGLIDSTAMFYNFTALTEFTSSLNSLRTASRMFSNCTSLESINVDNLDSLMIADDMFFNSSITGFSFDLPSLISGQSMFYQCNGLTDIKIRLDNVLNVSNMFSSCANLASFSGVMNNANVYTLGMLSECPSLTSVTIDTSCKKSDLSEDKFTRETLGLSEDCELIVNYEVK